MIKVVAVVLCGVLGGCATYDPWENKGPTPMPISDFCSHSRIMKPSRKDTAETLRQVAEHNSKVRALCAM